MPYKTPDLPTLIKRIKDDLQGDALQQSDAQVLARTLAGSIYTFYGALLSVKDQILPTTANEQTLTELANLRIGGRKQASVAKGKVQVKGTNGAFLKENTILKADDGRQYKTDHSIQLSGTTGTVSVTSVEKGYSQNLSADSQLKLVSPVASIEDVTVVLAPGITGGADIEAIEDLRQRVIRSFRIIPHGGDADDYITWALEVEGVTRAWVVKNHMGPGTVGVFCVRDGDTPITPDSGELKAVNDHIDVSGRPVTADVYVLAPTLKKIDFKIKVTPDTSTVRSAVERSLKNLIATESDLGGTILLSHIREAISLAIGEKDNTVLLPTSDVTCGKTELPVFGEITWQE